ncbi:MAG: cryptochrome/photolyase family protein [Gammaproteobacteria bacterium]|nr:cryptochrome/photolyase family protein [Gammaproteobacteria bacterium]
MSEHGLYLIFGDQLDRRSPALRECRKSVDRVLMIESREESQRIWSHKARSALFIAAMRHHRDWLREKGYRVDYVELDDEAAASFDQALSTALQHRQPDWLTMVEPGEFEVRNLVAAACDNADVALRVLDDPHFLCSTREFAEWRSGRKVLVMEHFYRHMRKRLDLLMEDGKPVGGEWNFDRKNRRPFGRKGPGILPELPRFEPDAVTREALAAVEKHFPDNPGRLDNFNWPVTREQALQALTAFVRDRLPAFGPFQDAMWQDQPYLHHSALSAALNLKLLDPREVVEAAVQAYRDKAAPLASVEGFVRQIVGWREYVRGVYWSEMPDYLDRNALDAQADLPDFYWNGDTRMHCLQQVIGQTLEHGYAHHIQRLMVSGLFALLFGVQPRQVHAWYLAIYVDAVEWVEAPNTLGMSQHADGGLLASKPYAASGRYIERMSNYCGNCRYQPGEATGDKACPFTTLYWDFLMRHEKRFADHPRAGMQWRNLARLEKDRRSTIQQRAAWLRNAIASGERI